MKQLTRLSKLMSERGLCSRREADRFIEKGSVLVDGQIVNTLGTKVSQDVTIELKEGAERHQEQKLTILLNKPLGYVSCQPEEGYQEALELIIEENRDKKFPTNKRLPHKLTKLAVVGRLDINSKGLLVLSQDGRVAKKIIGEHSEMEKEYLVRVEGDVTMAKIKQLQHGLELDGKALKRVNISQIDEHFLRFVLVEGKKRQIRRMCELVDLNVISIKRVRIGNVRLGLSLIHI